MSVNGGDGELNKLSREAFRSRVLNLDTAQGGKAYPRGWLAQQLGIDRKTLRKYLRVYDVGWPPFANRQIPEALHMVFTVAENGTLTYVSDYTCQLLGAHRDAIIGLNAADVFTPGEPLDEDWWQLCVQARAVPGKRFERIGVSAKMRAADGRALPVRGGTVWYSIQSRAWLFDLILADQTVTLRPGASPGNCCQCGDRGLCIAPSYLGRIGPSTESCH